MFYFIQYKPGKFHFSLHTYCTNDTCTWEFDSWRNSKDFFRIRWQLSLLFCRAYFL